MATPVDSRLVELHRCPLAWPLVAFAIVSGRCRADAEFLFAKNFGHSVARWIAGLFPADIDRLCDAAARFSAASPEVTVRQVLPLAVAFAGRPPSSLSVEDLDALRKAIDMTPRLTEAMRHGRRSDLSGRVGCCSRPGWSTCPPSTDDREARPPDKHDWARSPPQGSAGRCSPISTSGPPCCAPSDREAHQRAGHLRRVHLQPRP